MLIFRAPSVNKSPLSHRSPAICTCRNKPNHIKNNPCGFSCGLIYLLNTLKYDCSNTTVDGKCQSLAVANLSYYMSDMILSKSNIQITFLYLAHSIKNTIFLCIFQLCIFLEYMFHLQSARTFACGHIHAQKYYVVRPLKTKIQGMGTFQFNLLCKYFMKQLAW